MGNRMSRFRAEIERQEDQLFGIQLYFQGVVLFHSHDPETVRLTQKHYGEIVERGRTALHDAQILLSQVNIGAKPEEELDNFAFPPIEGQPGLDAMTRRASVLVDCYKGLFPQKTRQDAEGLSQDEVALLFEEAATRFSE
jgi:hypothetical protein